MRGCRHGTRSTSLVPPPGAVSTSRRPVQPARSRLHVSQPVTIFAPARRRQSLAIVRHLQDQCVSLDPDVDVCAASICAWRAMLLTASLKISRTSRRTSVANGRSRPASGALKENLIFRPGERVAREVAHPLEQVADTIAIGLMAQTMSPIAFDELTGGRGDAAECVARSRAQYRRPRARARSGWQSARGWPRCRRADRSQSACGHAR